MSKIGELDERVVVKYQLTTTQHGAIKGKTKLRVSLKSIDKRH